jgi:hypothetical protein
MNEINKFGIGMRLSLLAKIGFAAIISAVLALSPIVTPPKTVDAAQARNANRYFRDDGVVFEVIRSFNGEIIVSVEGYFNIFSGMNNRNRFYFRAGQRRLKELDGDLQSHNVRGLDASTFNWLQSQIAFMHMQPMTIIRHVREIPQFINHNPETLPTNHVLHNIGRDFVMNMANPVATYRDANGWVHTGEPSAEHRRQSDEFIRLLNANRRLDPASRAMHLNDAGMSAVLNNLDGIFPMIGTDDGVLGWYVNDNGLVTLFIATHAPRWDGAIVPVHPDIMTYFLFYEIGRALGYGMGLSNAKAEHFTGFDGVRDINAWGSEITPLFHRLGLHNVFANSFSNTQMQQFLNSQNLSAQERQWLSNQYDDTILDFNVPHFAVRLSPSYVRNARQQP